MSTTSKKAPTRHEEWQDSLKTTEDQYREYDAWIREEKEIEERRKKQVIDEIFEQKERLLEEKERNEERERIIFENKQRILKESLLKEEKIQKVNTKWYIKILKFIMGWE